MNYLNETYPKVEDENFEMLRGQGSSEDEPIINKKYLPSGDREIIGDLEILAYSRSKNWSIWGSIYSYRYILTGTPSEWRQTLGKLDSHNAFNKFLSAFLAEFDSAGFEIERNRMAQNRYHEGFIHKRKRKATEEDLLLLLRALYDEDDASSSNIDLPNTFMEQDANVLSYQAIFHYGLSDIVTDYQQKIIRWKSEQRGSAFFEYKDLIKLAEEGQMGWPALDRPLTEGMITNAINTAGYCIGLYFDAHDKGDNTEKLVAADMLKNCSLIIKAALDQAESSINETSAIKATVFSSLWRLIPFTGVVIKPLSKLARPLIKDFIESSLSSDQGYSDTESIKIGLSRDFSNLVNKIQVADESKAIDAVQYELLKTVFDSFLSRK